MGGGGGAGMTFGGTSSNGGTNKRPSSGTSGILTSGVGGGGSVATLAGREAAILGAAAVASTTGMVVPHAIPSIIHSAPNTIVYPTTAAELASRTASRATVSTSTSVAAPSSSAASAATAPSSTSVLPAEFVEDVYLPATLSDPAFDVFSPAQLPDARLEKVVSCTAVVLLPDVGSVDCNKCDRSGSGCYEAERSFSVRTVGTTVAEAAGLGGRASNNTIAPSVASLPPLGTNSTTATPATCLQEQPGSSLGAISPVASVSSSSVNSAELHLSALPPVSSLRGMGEDSRNHSDCGQSGDSSGTPPTTGNNSHPSTATQLQQSPPHIDGEELEGTVFLTAVSMHDVAGTADEGSEFASGAAALPPPAAHCDSYDHGSGGDSTVPVLTPGPLSPEADPPGISSLTAAVAAVIARPTLGSGAYSSLVRSLAASILSVGPKRKSGPDTFTSLTAGEEGGEAEVDSSTSSHSHPSYSNCDCCGRSYPDDNSASSPSSAAAPSITSGSLRSLAGTQLHFDLRGTSPLLQLMGGVSTRSVAAVGRGGGVSDPLFSRIAAMNAGAQVHSGAGTRGVVCMQQRLLSAPRGSEALAHSSPESTYGFFEATAGSEASVSRQGSKGRGQGLPALPLRTRHSTTTATLCSWCRPPPPPTRVMLTSSSSSNSLLTSSLASPSGSQLPPRTSRGSGGNGGGLASFSTLSTTSPIQALIPGGRGGAGGISGLAPRPSIAAASLVSRALSQSRAASSTAASLTARVGTLSREIRAETKLAAAIVMGERDALLAAGPVKIAHAALEMQQERVASEWSSRKSEVWEVL